MLPKKLAIQGLYAFPDKLQVIDFERLTEAQLFGIFGATGSGKSSILEAISFVLYGETDRLNKNDRRNYNMLNLRANRLWIDFEFLAGREEQSYYRFTAEIKRRKSSYSETTSPRREAFVKQGEEWLPIETGKVTEILGLSYENFRRTVIIPQGKFQEFLSLGNTDRTRMLREIFRLERFELYDRVKRLIQKNDRAITREETLLNQLAAVTAEVLEAKEIMLQRNTDSEEEATQALAELEKALKRLDAQKELMVQLALKRSELELLSNRKLDIEQRKEKLRRFELARLSFAHLIQQRDSLTADLEQHKVSLSELQKQREAIAEKLNKARRTHAHIKTEYDQREQLQAQAAELRRLGNTRVLRVEISQLDGRLTEGTAMIAAAQDSLSKLKKSEAEADMRYRALREASLDLDSVLEAHLSQLTASLEDGKPCPVCGSLHHATHHLKHQEGKAKGTGSTKLLQARLAAAKENSKALKASEEALDLARKEGSKAEEALRKLESFHQELQQHRTTLQANLNAETGSYRLIDAKQFDQHSQDQLERLAADALNKYHGLGSLFQKEQERIDELLASQHKQEGMFQQVQSRQMDLMKKEATLVQQLQAALQSSDFEDLDTIASLLLEPLDVPEEKLAIERWTNQYNKAQLAVEQAEAQTSTITYDAEAHDELKTKARETSEALKQRLIEIGSLKQNIELLKKQLEEKKAIRKRHTALLRRADNLKLMRRLFTGSGFVNYVSAMYLRQLCQAANERFRKLTHNQLQLEPTEDNSFAVRDFLNDGQLRSHKTLSGGQVFQASLCLALALADQVQAREGSHQRFFFIDEGFGALDKNALKLVFEALRALRKEQRIVGIISHVEELQEDIDTYLHIENDGDTGSQVRPSWL